MSLTRRTATVGALSAGVLGLDLALAGARLDRFRAAAVLAFAPVGQLLAAALLIVPQ